MFINDSLRFSPSATESSKGMHTSGNSSKRTRAQNVIYSGVKGTKSLLLSPD